eukprot:Lankesteria_metandrocarpae@DN1246_c0_g1_i1.p1
MNTNQPNLSRCGDDFAQGAPHYEFREEVVHGATVSTATALGGGGDPCLNQTNSKVPGGAPWRTHANGNGTTGGQYYIHSTTIPNPFSSSPRSVQPQHTPTSVQGTGGYTNITAIGSGNDQKSRTSPLNTQPIYTGHSSNSKRRHRRSEHGTTQGASRPSSDDSCCRDSINSSDLPTEDMRIIGGVERTASYQQANSSRRGYNSHRGHHGGERGRRGVVREDVAVHHAPYYQTKGAEGKESGAAGATDEDGYDAHVGEGALGFIGVLRSQPFLTSMILFIPIAFTSYWLNWGDPVVFSLNFVAIVPMAWLMGKATEDLSAHMGQITGGLLNAWFGNVVEMLLCIAGLRRGELVVVRSTLIGSILSNLLLVTGCSFLLGGMRHKVQEFSAIGASTNASLMTLSCMCLGLPTIYASILSSAKSSELNISRAVSFFLIFVYIQYLVFQLVTHSFLFTEDDEEQADLSVWGAAILLLVCSVLCSFHSDYLVSSIEGVVTKFSLSKEFIGIILLPIVGN